MQEPENIKKNLEGLTPEESENINYFIAQHDFNEPLILTKEVA